MRGYRITRRPEGRRYSPGKTIYTESRGLLDLGATRFQQIGNHASFGFGCGCIVTVDPGAQFTSIMPGCSYGHPFAWHGSH